MVLSVQYARGNGETRNDTFCIFDLATLLPGHVLLVNISLSIVSLLRQHEVIVQRVLSEAEMRVLLPLLDAPDCCQQAVLQAGYFCTYDFLLKVLISPDVQITNEWNALVQGQWKHLNRASAKKTRRVEMRGVYNAIFGLRQKLEQLGLTIRVQRDGYYLCKMKEDL